MPLHFLPPIFAAQLQTAGASEALRQHFANGTGTVLGLTVPQWLALHERHGAKTWDVLTDILASHNDQPLPPLPAPPARQVAPEETDEQS